MKALLAIDLDQTLIYSTRSCGDVSGIETVWVEHSDGEPLSLMTRAAHDLFRELTLRHHVVPVTTRTPEQVGRVQLPGAVTYQLCANGGVLLHGGARDPEWDAWVADELRLAAPAEEVHDFLGDLTSEPWVRSMRQVEGLFVYVVANSRDDFPAEWLAELVAFLEPRGWGLSLQGRKTYLVPTSLSKGTAALRLAHRLGAPLLAAGDSVLDRDLLEAAVYAIRPAQGELEALGYAGAVVTRSRGALAAEEILRALGEQADSGAPGLLGEAVGR